MKKARQRQDNLNGLTLDSVQKTRQRALENVVPSIGHWLQVSQREQRLVKGATKAEQKAYLLGLKRPLFEVERNYLKTL